MPEIAQAIGTSHRNARRLQCPADLFGPVARAAVTRAGDRHGPAAGRDGKPIERQVRNLPAAFRRGRLLPPGPCSGQYDES